MIDVSILDGVKYVLIDLSGIHSDTFFNFVVDNNFGIGRCNCGDVDVQRGCSKVWKEFESIKEAANYARDNNLSGLTVVTVTNKEGREKNEID
jgi:hypothetical protein